MKGLGMKKTPFRLLFLAFLLGMPLAVRAESTADQVDISTPKYRPDSASFQNPEGTYTYEVSWQGIPAAEAKLSVRQDGLKYIVDSSARTYSAIDLFYKLRYQATGRLSAVDLHPIDATFEQRENSRVK